MRAACLALACLTAACAVRARPRLDSAADLARFESDERELAELARSFDAEVEHMGVLDGDTELERYLDGVLERVAPEFAEVLRVRLLRAPSARAEMLESGTLYVDAGALAVLGDEAQLAALLAHAVAHFRLRHPARRDFPFDDGWVVVDHAYRVDYGRSRKTGAACDPLACDALVRAGYDIASAADGWDRLRSYQARPAYPDYENALDRGPALRRFAATHAGGESGRERYLAATRAVCARVLASSLERFDPDGAFVLVSLADGRLEPAEAAYWNARAHALRAGPHEREDELALLEECLRLAPGFAPAEGRLGTRLAHAGQPVRARVLLAHAIANTADAGERSFLERTLAEIGP